MGEVVAFVRPAGPVAPLLQRLRQLHDERAAVSLAVREAEARVKANRRANRLAWAANDGEVASEWTAAVGRRLDRARLASIPLKVAACELHSRLSEVREALGPLLSRVGKAEASRLYGDAFPDHSRKRVEREVSAILSAHRMTQWRRAGAL